jgi:hypothetical protein
MKTTTFNTTMNLNCNIKDYCCSAGQLITSREAEELQMVVEPQRESFSESLRLEVGPSPNGKVGPMDVVLGE